ncbi:helix-turn-helix transcriptional regulator [Clostridium gasigenes]|uniref:helix-turn-helix transcriptional regulator n=1 Tax=Clostridium gasigenes TaxID=94869 RepID=UPI0016280005|nr:helix-turn-helix transcriptional regulator [Clostridium gasigenes]MBB6625530.1 helix-turn-helix transcriptional regulator [Clostridium gasigenes]
MVKILILFYLNIKDTHGYEIQKFIQTSGFDGWTNVKPGSIYYSLSKMEKNGEIILVKEEHIDSRVRKIYQITELGKAELEKAIEKELSNPLVPLNFDKFILPITFNKLDKKTAKKIIDKKIHDLNEILEYWSYWKNIKINEESSKVERISFEMTISNYRYELEWYSSLVDEFDYYCELSRKNELMIKRFKFESIQNSNKEDYKVESVDELKDIILNNPDKAKIALERLIDIIKN